MAISMGVRFSVPWEFVAPQGALCLGVEPSIDFSRRGQGDDQERDKETGERVWVAKCLDLDPEAGKFGASKEFKIKVIAPVQPVPPPSAVPGYPPMVEFTDVTIAPWTDSQRCRGGEPGRAHKCRARLSWSIRATGITEPLPVGKTSKAA